MHLKFNPEDCSWKITRISEEEKKGLVTYGVGLLLGALSIEMQESLKKELKEFKKEVAKSTKH